MAVVNRRFVLISTAAVALAAFLPWVTVFGISVSGIRGDGQITLMLALVGILLAWVAATRRWARAVEIVLAVLALLVALYHLTRPAAGVGVVVTLFAAIAWVVFAWAPPKVLR